MWSFIKSKLYLMYTLSIIILLTTTYMLGIKSEKSRREVESLKSTIKVLRKSKEIGDEVESYNLTTIDTELDKWMR